MKYIQELGTAQIAQHVEQTHSLWGRGTTVEQRGRLLKERLEYAGNDLFLSGMVDAKGYLVCSMKRYRFELAVRKQIQGCVGLGAIFTDAGFRKQGFASQLIAKVLEDSRERLGCGFALLYSDIGNAYYENFGFQATPSLAWKLPLASLGDAAALELRVATEVDRASLLRWYREYTSRFTVKPVRTDRMWNFFRKLNGIERDYVLSRNGAELGFLTVSLDAKQSCLCVEEWLAPPEHEAAVWAAVRTLAQKAGCKEVRGWHQLNMKMLVPAMLVARVDALPMIAALAGEVSLAPLLKEELADTYFTNADHF